MHPYCSIGFGMLFHKTFLTTEKNGITQYDPELTAPLWFCICLYGWQSHDIQDKHIHHTFVRWVK
jgi:hypothetical protein